MRLMALRAEAGGAGGGRAGAGWRWRKEASSLILGSSVILPGS